jgi:alkanesulfonate monooxygenase SsuD/methylene tetrahydromethanopterin reductase-like flavin-dependent oxidoreductase (luciferase family)
VAREPARRDSEPFAPGSISLRLYPHNDLDAPHIVRELCHQGRLALDGGFDGIMTSEHHGGIGGYLPNPLQMAAFVLEEAAAGWAAPCPLLLPLRPTAMVAEEIAWLAARHPGRVGLGVAAGALPLDFEAMGIPLAAAVPRFKSELPRIVAMLAGVDLRGLEGDQALKHCAEAPVTVLSAAASPAAARRAALAGAGILTEGMSSAERLAAFCRAYDEAGGRGPKVAVRRVWLGHPPAELITAQRSVYDSFSAARFGDDQTVASTDPDEVAGRLAALATETGATAVNLRVHLPGVSPAVAREQIGALASEVVPRLRRLLRAKKVAPLREGPMPDEHPVAG